MTDAQDRLDRAVAAMKAAEPCAEHAARVRGVMRVGGWPWIFDEDNPCAACARLALLAALRVLGESHADLHSASPCCVFRELDRLEQEARDR